MSRPAFLRRFARVAWLMPLVLLCPAVTSAQATRESPAHIALVEGTAVLERDGETDRAPSSMPLLAGDRVRTQTGRVEVLFSDGSTLHLDNHTVVDFQSDEVIRLLEGRVRLAIPGPNRALAYRIDAPSAWVDIEGPGEYRVAVVAGPRGREVELAVLRGAADLVNEDGETSLRAGERAFAQAGSAPSEPYVFNSAAWDAFDRWSEDRRNARLGLSSQYLPNEVRHYSSTFDHHGDWRYEAQYGYVWYPRVSLAGWRPYYHGRWAHLRPFGWTWIGADPWAWPTHHYGRWGFSAGVWFWIPGRVWGPAWVSWAYAPGYVSWCPLGWNNRPVIGFLNAHYYGGRRFDPWHAWTVVPHRRFGGGHVNINVININRIDVRTRSAFVERAAAPTPTGFAVPRAETPIRLAGSRSGFAVPRGGATGDRPATPATPDTEAFRRRGRTTERSGGGFPAPAREPRPGAVPRSGEAPGVRSRERSPDSAAPAEGGSLRRGSPGEAPSAAPPEGRTPSRRAVPRSGGDASRGSGGSTRSAPPAGSGSAAPSRGAESSATPAAPSAGSGRSRAVPRGRGGDNPYFPSQSSRAPRAEAPPDSAPPVFRGRVPSEAPRAEPRPGLSGGDREMRRAPGAMAPPSYSRPQADRPPGRMRGAEVRPGPAPSAGPPARSAAPRAEPPASGPSGRAPASQPQARPRGGQSPSGRAVPRGGR